MNAITPPDNSQVLESIANWMVSGITVKQIAVLLGVEEVKVEQLMMLPAYAAIEVRIIEEREKQDKGFNDLADAIEQTAGQTLYDQLQYNKDPEFALKVYVHANKARRRAVGGNHPIEGNTSMRATFNLPLVFINKLQQNGGQLNIGGVTANVARQNTDMLRPTEVERLLMQPKQVEEVA